MSTPTTLNCQGLACPKPVLETKESLDKGIKDLLVLVDNEASKNNVSKFARSRGCVVSAALQEDGIIWAIRIHTDSATSIPEEELALEEFSCEIPDQSSKSLRTIYVISSDTMGQGDSVLGKSLLQTYIQTIPEIEPLPKEIIFYNSGVKILASPSDALETLKKLQTQGVDIMACGTCLDFYQLTASLQVGEISNMFMIMAAMNQADKILSPY